MSDEPTTGPSSWRDVYSLVQDVEARLAGSLDEVEKRLNARMDGQSAERRAVTNDFEVRLRLVERAQLINQQADTTSKTALGAMARAVTIGLSILAIVISALSLVLR